MKLKNLNRSGFTLVEVMIVVCIIGLVATIAVPNFVQARAVSRRNTCIANLRQIDNAKTTWGAEKRKSLDTVPADDELFGPSRYLAEKPVCPSEGDYEVQPLKTKPTCSLGETDGHTL
jgi:prepilin-type N-terminal cleavage/methylation domain-containing protein